MDKLVEFRRKAWFVVQVLSGYEETQERMIRSYRLQLQKRLEKAQARKEELRKLQRGDNVYGPNLDVEQFASVSKSLGE